MSSAKDHYDNHFAEFYSWMCGNFAANVKENEAFFKDNHILPFSNKTAIDLGSGHGIHSCALNNLGFKVIAVDFSKKLLDELKQNSAGKVEVIEADITDFKAYSSLKPELIVCMGDTLTHLPMLDDVLNLIKNSVNIIPGNGKIVLSFRNYNNELTGDSRFIPVKSDENRILTCFLEYEKNYVNVNDIFYERKNDKWLMKVSSHRKLRLSPEYVINELTSNGCSINKSEAQSGMVYIIAQKN